MGDIMFAHVYKHVAQQDAIKYRKNGPPKIKMDAWPKMVAELDKLIAMFKPTVIVTNDHGTCGLFTNNNCSIDQCRGSVYDYKGLPSIIIQNAALQHGTKQGSWVMVNDWQKIGRWFRGQQREQPKFNYTVCRTVDDVRNMYAVAPSAVLNSVDIENFGNVITVVGFTFVLPDGRFVSYVIPFHSGSGPFWATEEDEIEVWKIVRAVLDLPTPKVMQNGNYDNSWFLLYRMPARNYFFDTAVLFWSIWCEAEKRLNFQSSILLDHYKFWKDDAKGEKDEKINPGIMERYWRYNALDTYYTACNFRVLAYMLCQPSMAWARTNYIKGMQKHCGPAFAMTMAGHLRIDFKELNKMDEELGSQAERTLNDLRVMTDTPDFNPNSSAQVASFLYDVLGMKAPKLRGKAASKLNPRSVDEKVLKLTMEQHPLIKIAVEKLWEYKKPLNNQTKYTRKNYRDGRFHTSLDACATETSRWNSKVPPAHLGVGNNAQNIPAKMRGFLVADKGRVLFDNDFSQSDARFVAFESEEQKFIETVTSGRDSHCVHAAHFFKIPFETIYSEYKAGVDFYANDVTGVRAITKKLVHGCNYQMAAFTLYMTMGKKAVIAAAIAIGHSNAANYTERQLVEVCESFIRSYVTELYPGIPKWVERIISECIKNGNKATNAFGFTRLFFGNLGQSKDIARELSAFYGQSDTAGNIDRAICDAFYKYKLWEHGLRFHLQVHDSFVFSTPQDKLWLNQNVLDIMNEYVTVRGRSMNVPADSKCGIRWKKGMIKWTPELTYEEIVARTGQNVCYLSQSEVAVNSVMDFGELDFSDDEESHEEIEASDLELVQ